MKNQWIDRTIEQARIELDNSRDQSIANRLDHLERSMRRAQKMAKKISKSENVPVDVELVSLGALLHDIDEHYSHDATAVDKSVSRARQILERINYPQDRIQRVLTIISEHSSEKLTPSSSIESKIVYDADKIDGVGATGIVRVFELCGQQGKMPHEAIAWYHKKINIALPEMKTELGKKVVEKRLKYVYKFLNQYEKEQKKLL